MQRVLGEEIECAAGEVRAQEFFCFPGGALPIETFSGGGGVVPVDEDRNLGLGKPETFDIAARGRPGARSQRLAHIGEPGDAGEGAREALHPRQSREFAFKAFEVVFVHRVSLIRR